MRSNAEREQFAHIASHDLQEPLRMISSYVQLLSWRYKGKLDNDADEFIEYAVEGTSRMQQLIGGLLAYSRVGTRGRPPAPTSLEQALSEALANLRMALEESGAVVTHNDLPLVLADNVQIVQLFQNLIGNAIKFRSEQGPRVHISARQNEREWTISVQDNGIGIDPQFYESSCGPVEILLVEDNPGDVRLTVEALKESRIASRRSVAKDGFEALAFLRREGMPFLPGRTSSSWTSTSQRERDIAATYDLHANCYITKPVDFNQFMRVVRSIEHFWFVIVKLPPKEEFD